MWRKHLFVAYIICFNQLKKAQNLQYVKELQSVFSVKINKTFNKYIALSPAGVVQSRLRRDWVPDFRDWQCRPLIFLFIVGRLLFNIHIQFCITNNLPFNLIVNLTYINNLFIRINPLNQFIFVKVISIFYNSF